MNKCLAKLQLAVQANKGNKENKMLPYMCLGSRAIGYFIFYLCFWIFYLFKNVCTLLLQCKLLFRNRYKRKTYINLYI